MHQIRLPTCAYRERVHATFFIFALSFAAALAAQQPGPADFAREVDRRLDVPEAVAAEYAGRLERALAAGGVGDRQSQYYVMVDRSERVQAVFVYWRSPDGGLQLIGASPASTGSPGGFEHFLTPTGAYEHWLANPDFRAEGTRNANGIMGYGRKGMRVFDFGWVTGERTWGARGLGQMRLQLHATDPELLEPQLGTRRSKGCIRIPATLNVFIDRHGLLDADYNAELAAGEHFWVLRADRGPTRTPGRWLVVIDSQRSARPAWARATPSPRAPRSSR